MGKPSVSRRRNFPLLMAVFTLWSARAYCDLNTSPSLTASESCSALSILNESRRGWTTEGPELESRYGQELLFLHVAQAGCGARPSLLCNVCQGLFFRRQSVRTVKLTTQLHLVSRSRKLPTCHHAVMIN
jgi:hypothetical protein